MDGERLKPEDEKAVVEKLLRYHPRAEDKIGCGLDSIMVMTKDAIYLVLVVFSNCCDLLSCFTSRC